MYGPGSAGALPVTTPPAPTIAPDHPTPGIIDLTHRLNEGYAYSYNVFMRDTGTSDIRDLQTDIHEVTVPPSAGWCGSHPPEQRATLAPRTPAPGWPPQPRSTGSTACSMRLHAPSAATRPPPCAPSPSAMP